MEGSLLRLMPRQMECPVHALGGAQFFLPLTRTASHFLPLHKPLQHWLLLRQAAPLAPQVLGVLQVVPLQPDAQEVHCVALLHVRLQAGAGRR